MSNGKVMITNLIVGLIKQTLLYKVSYFPEPAHSKNEIKFELDLSNYPTKTDLKSTTGVGTFNGFQNVFVYQPMLNTLELKKDKSTDYVFSWKSKRVYNSKILYAALLHSIKLSGYKVKINFNTDPLAVE